MSIVDCAIYEHGERQAGDLEVHQAYESARDRPDAFVWIGLKEPTPEEFDSVTREFDLHELAVEDAIKAHQRPKLEVYGDTLFMVLKTACYHDAEEAVEIGELLLFVGDGFLISVRHGAASALDEVRRRVEGRPDLLRCGPGAVLHAIVDRVVDDYGPVLEGLENDIEEIEVEVFSPERRTNPTERIYKLKREMLEMHRATAPLAEPLDRLAKGHYEPIPTEVRDYFRDVYDHAVRADEIVDGFREMLNGILDANVAQISVRQNDDMRKISAWVAIVALPTSMAAIWGMNFDHMPELHWAVGYPAALTLMLVICFVLHRVFKRAGWL